MFDSIYNILLGLFESPSSLQVQTCEVVATVCVFLVVAIPFYFIFKLIKSFF